jgi:hypothetical protein
MKRYTRRDKQAMCDALNVLYWKMDKTRSQWLATIGREEIEDGIGVSLYWDADAEEFKIRD